MKILISWSREASALKNNATREIFHRY